MSTGADPKPSGEDVTREVGEGDAEEARRYWRAAISHLPSGKQEAAWNFYLERMEGIVPAADTLGGIMLLLEAHLAFFEHLPARLGQAVRQVETTAALVSDPHSPPASVPPVGGDRRKEPRTFGQRSGWRSRLLLPLSVAVATSLLTVLATKGGVAAYYRREAREFAARLPAPQGAAFLLWSNGNRVAVRPWTDAASGRPLGFELTIHDTARTEQTKDGNTTVYVRSSVEQLREDLQKLRSLQR